jgi:hypothetical protein
MRAVSFWSGREFGLLEAFSVLSTVRRTTFEPVEVFFDKHSAPTGRFWDMLDGIARLRKRPAHEELKRIAATFLGGVLPTNCHPAVHSDLFRYGFLLEHGGTWFDLDSIQVRDLRPLAEQRRFLAGREDSSIISTGVLSAPAGHPILAALLREAREHLCAHEIEYRAIGPPLFTKLVKAEGLEDTILPERYFYPVHYSRGTDVVYSRFPLSRDTYSVHVWGSHNRWVFKDRDLAHFSGVQSTLLDLLRVIAS